MKDKIWNLFKITGDIKYYMMFKEMEKEEQNASSKNQRNNS